ncbi:PREDICTED: reverse mRNAase, partial [Prunus dulcis]
ADLEGLTCPVSIEEIKNSVFAIGRLKTPGPDGFPALFYQDYWGVCSDDIISFVQDCFNTATLPDHLNETLIALVPKVERPMFMNQLRPISLCNTLYKVVSKILVARLRPCMTKLVSPNQVSFVPGRQITDNIIVAQEVLHKFKNAKGKKGFIAWKIDLSKAYDRMQWPFIREVLWEYKAILNGELTDSFSPQCGIRQGDPLSPYIFVLCMEKLSHLIQQKIHDRAWKSVQICQGGPHISHLFFADDLILFGEATIDQAWLMKQCLDDFCQLSGQCVSFEKSMICVSPNTCSDLANSIATISGSPLTASLGKYLGVPLIHTRVSKQTYQEVIAKAQKRLASWKSHTLSMAGRITLLQSVTAAIPIYTMQTAKLPMSVCDKLDQLNRNFLWGHTSNTSKIHLVNWEQVCKPKIVGGLGIKRSAWMNQALLAKTGWRLLQHEQGLWSQ